MPSRLEPIKAAWRAAPKPLRAASTLWAAAGVWAVITAISMLIAAANAVNRATDALNGVGQFSDSQEIRSGEFMAKGLAPFQGIATGMSFGLIVVALLMCACYVLLGFFALKGKAAPRVVATVLAALSLPGLFMGAGVFFGVLLGIAGVVFAWQKPVTYFIRAKALPLPSYQPRSTPEGGQ
ncbi:hypothetical protein [Arthrobacter sp. RCC_34]|uniref:hypothetical protein n=1 Tax=Arthrobacter sp. RCC_34 TaxID=3239230 RepID=UPI00352419B9